MNLMRFNHQPNFPGFFNNFEKALSDNFENSQNNVPSVNIKDEDKSFVVELAVPGMEKKDFSVKLDNNKMTVSSERKEEKAESNSTYSIKEFSFNSFSRSFTLPKNIEFENVKADYKDGILSINLPKKEAEVKLKREIKIS